METERSEDNNQEPNDAELSKEMEKLLAGSADPELDEPPELAPEPEIQIPTASKGKAPLYPRDENEFSQTLPPSEKTALTNGKPTILLLSLDEKIPFDTTHSSFLDTLLDISTVKRSKKPKYALGFLSREFPSAILATDAGLSLAKHKDLYSFIVDNYVKEGGTLICMGEFPSFVAPPALAPFFQGFGLDWEMETYMRTTVFLDGDAVPEAAKRALPEKYNLKGVFLKNVKRNEAWYRPGESSVEESGVDMLGVTSGHMAERVTDYEQTPVAVAKVAKGRFCFVGDTNAEKETESVILAMCGLNAGGIEDARSVETDVAAA